MTIAAAAGTEPVIERVTPTDLAFLAMDRASQVEQFAAILMLAPGPSFDLNQAAGIFAQRIARVPRLRQRLRRLPPGCGRPIWADDAGFAVGRHIRHVRCPAPGDREALLGIANDLLTTRLPRDRPLWRAAFVTGLAGGTGQGTVALIIVIHHVLADGIGGLAVLGTLVDGAEDTGSDPGFPRRPPGPARLAADAARARLAALRQAGATWRALRTSMSAGGGLTPPAAARSSLNRRTGPRFRLAVVSTDLEALRTSAHRYGATVNDAVLTAVGGALRELLLSRNEDVDTFAVAVPVAARRRADVAQLGNQVAPLLVIVPGTGDPVSRLTQVARSVAAGKSAATGPPPIALIGPLFRIGAALGGYRWYMNHQHRLHTLVSHVRGPDHRVVLAGAEVISIIPAAVGLAGNITVAFEVLTYAGTLTVTAVADRDRTPDLPVLMRLLDRELNRVSHLV